MEHVVDNSTACGLREARPHPVDHPPRAPELGEGAAGMVLTFYFCCPSHTQASSSTNYINYTDPRRMWSGPWHAPLPPTRNERERKRSCLHAGWDRQTAA